MNALKRDWDLARSLQPESWILKLVGYGFIALLVKNVVKNHLAVVLQTLWQTPLGAVEGQLGWLFRFVVQAFALCLLLNLFDRLRRDGRKPIEAQAAADAKKMTTLEKAVTDTEAAYRAAYAARRKPPPTGKGSSAAIDPTLLEDDETKAKAAWELAKTALSDYKEAVEAASKEYEADPGATLKKMNVSPGVAQKFLDAAKKGDETLAKAISFMGRTWIIALMMWVGIRGGSELYRLTLSVAEVPADSSLAKAVGVAALFAGIAFSDLIFFALFKGKMEWKGFWGSLGSGTVIVIATLIVTGWTQGFIENHWPATSGDHWAFTLLPRDTTRLGENPVMPDVDGYNNKSVAARAGTFSGWTMVPCSTRLRDQRLGSAVYVIGELAVPKPVRVDKDKQPDLRIINPDPDEAKAFVGLVRLQALADNRTSDPASDGWTDHVSGRLIPWRFYIEQGVSKDGKPTGVLVRITDRRKAFGPDGEKVFDLSLYSKPEQVEKVKKAYALQSQLGGASSAVRDILGGEMFTWGHHGVEREAPKGGIYNP